MISARCSTVLLRCCSARPLCAELRRRSCGTPLSFEAVVHASLARSLSHSCRLPVTDRTQPLAPPRRRCSAGPRRSLTHSAMSLGKYTLVRQLGRGQAHKHRRTGTARSQ